MRTTLRQLLVIAAAAIGVDADAITGALTAGKGHTCVKLWTNQVQCWGNGKYGQLGDGEFASKNIGVFVTGLSNVEEVAAGYWHTCAVTSDGEVFCWGWNVHGQLGLGVTVEITSVPIKVAGITDAISVSCGGYHTCALRSNKHIKCWGYNVYGQLGDNDPDGHGNPLSPIYFPLDVVDIDDALSISAGGWHTCARREGGTASVPAQSVWCWGQGLKGRLGNGNLLDRLRPVQIHGGLAYSGVSASSPGGAHSCGIVSDADRKVQCWGDAHYGGLGNGQASGKSPFPVTVVWNSFDALDLGDEVTGAEVVDAGWWHTCFVTNDNKVACWGQDHYGQLGQGAIGWGVQPHAWLVYLSYQPLVELVNVISVGCGKHHTCVLLSDGSVKCWGLNDDGQTGCGHNDNTGLPCDTLIGTSTTSTTTLHPLCSEVSGGGFSDEYPCLCGASVCTQDQLCHEGIESGTCLDACPAHYAYNCHPRSGCSCVPCTEGHRSNLGGPCLPLIGYCVDGLVDPTMHSVTRDEEENITLMVTVGEFCDETFEGDPMHFVFDIKPTTPELSIQDPCRDAGWHFDVGPTVSSITLTYADLAGPCRMSAANVVPNTPPGTIHRDGFLGIWAVSNRTDAQGNWYEHIEKQWIIGLNFIFNAWTNQTLDMFTDTVIHMDAGIFHLGDFRSVVTAYLNRQDMNNGNSMIPEYEIGEPVYIRHALAADASISEKLYLEIVEVFLSTHEDPENASAMIHDLTPQIILLSPHNPSERDFKFYARACTNCYLNVLSRVSHRGDEERRLQDGEEEEANYVYQSLFVRFVPADKSDISEAQPTASTAVHLSLVVEGVDYNALVERPKLQGRFVRELKRQVAGRFFGYVQAHDCSVMLSPGSVHADVEVRPPTSLHVEDIEAAIGSPMFQPSLAMDVTAGIAALLDVELVTEGSISTRVLKVDIVDLAAAEEAEKEAAADSATLQAVEIGTIVAMSVCLVGMVACAVFLWCRAEQFRRETTEARQAIKAKPHAGTWQDAAATPDLEMSSTDAGASQDAAAMDLETSSSGASASQSATAAVDLEMSSTGAAQDASVTV